MIPHIHTTNPRHAKQLWYDLGGTIEPVRRTGEVRFEIGHYSPISSQEAARLADKLLLELETL